MLKRRLAYLLQCLAAIRRWDSKESYDFQTQITAFICT